MIKYADRGLVEQGQTRPLFEYLYVLYLFCSVLIGLGESNFKSTNIKHSNIEKFRELYKIPKKSCLRYDRGISIMCTISYPINI